MDLATFDDTCAGSGDIAFLLHHLDVGVSIKREYPEWMVYKGK